MEETLQDASKAQSSLHPCTTAVEQLCITSYKWWHTWSCPDLVLSLLMAKHLHVC